MAEIHAAIVRQARSEGGNGEHIRLHLFMMQVCDRALEITRTWSKAGCERNGRQSTGNDEQGLNLEGKTDCAFLEAPNVKRKGHDQVPQPLGSTVCAQATMRALQSCLRLIFQPFAMCYSEQARISDRMTFTKPTSTRSEMSTGHTLHTPTDPTK